ncbi:hypothetical protein D3C85_1399030 [compost metagenome]
MIHRNGRHILPQQVFRLLIILASLLGGFGFRRINQRFVIRRVAVLAGIFAVTGAEVVQESRGIVVIGNPGVAHGIEVMRVHSIEHGLPLLILQLRFHAEIFLPHRASRDGDALMRFRGVIEQIETERMRVVETCFTQQLFRFRDTLIHRPAGVVRCLEFYATNIRLADDPRRTLPLP